MMFVTVRIHQAMKTDTGTARRIASELRVDRPLAVTDRQADQWRRPPGSATRRPRGVWSSVDTGPPADMSVIIRRHEERCEFFATTLLNGRSKMVFTLSVVGISPSFWKVLASLAGS